MVHEDDLSRRLLAFMRKAAPFAYCDACLALRLNASLSEMSAALTALLAEAHGLERGRRACYGCGRTLVLTALSDEPHR
jgi:hypothetical protein